MVMTSSFRRSSPFQAGKLFKFQDGTPKITRLDESTICKNVFLVGPHVQHQKAVFCFIYKYVLAMKLRFLWRVSPSLPPSLPPSFSLFCPPPHKLKGVRWLSPILLSRYRQRFAVVAKEMLERLRSMSGMEVIQEYSKKNFLMEDLSGCGNACPC